MPPTDEYPEGMNPFCGKCGSFHNKDNLCPPRTLTKDEKTIAALNARILRLELAIRKHKDKYIFTNPDFEDYELWSNIE